MNFEKFDKWIVEIDRNDHQDNLFNGYFGTKPIQNFSQKKSCFGYVGYPKQHSAKKSLKKSRQPLFFYETKKKILLSRNEIEQQFVHLKKSSVNFVFPSKEKYLEKVKKIKAHILRGDVYEINYCVQFTAQNVSINPAHTFLKLYELSEAPHAMLARFGNIYIICSSPERFLMREGNRLITQPMKGTAKRGANATDDEKIKNALAGSLKEQTENVMAVDVARHDLSRIAKKGSVVTTELFGVYTFKQVHQMVSTVVCDLKENSLFSDIIEAVFPPASMTGAPKIRAMELVRDYEDFDRGFYSGAIGTMKENGDFDLAVVIRSLIFDSEKKRLSFAVGSAITAMSDPEQEWEECMLKARAMIQALE